MKFLTALATEQGVSHKSTDTPCQDSVLVKKEDDYLFLGLADGAGSAKHSDIGSSRILKFLSVHMRIAFDYYKNEEDSNEDLLKAIHMALDNSANYHKVKIEDLSSTLLFIAIQNDDYIVTHIGDGVIGTLDKDDELSVFSEPENGEFANQTYFITSNDSNRVRIYRGDISDFNGLVLMSDGVEDSLYEYKTRTLASITRTMIKWLDTGSEEEISSALKDNLKRVFSKKSQDDLSIAILRIHKDDIEFLEEKKEKENHENN